MAMDVKREGVAKKKMIKRIIIVTLTVAAVGGISWQLSKLKPAAPTVERATVWIDAVKRGPMVRDLDARSQVGRRASLQVADLGWVLVSHRFALDNAARIPRPDFVICNRVPGSCVHAGDSGLGNFTATGRGAAVAFSRRCRPGFVGPPGRARRRPGP